MTSHQDHDNDGYGEPPTEVVKVNLQDVIRERKAERKLKAEEKRQADLHRIRDMRSTTGIDPLQRFPKEIWAKIFDELNPEDRGNVWQLHPLFRDLLEKNRLRDILLPQVLNVIHTQYPRTRWRRRRQNDFNEHLRLISKSLRKWFDHWKEDKLTRSIEENRCGESPCNLDIVSLNFYSTQDAKLLKRLLASFRSEEESSAKRFFLRGVSIDEEDDVEDRGIEEDNSLRMDQFETDIGDLLKCIGDQIWHFRFFLDELKSVYYNFSELYILLHGWISLMPNLKWLEVSIEPSHQTINKTEGNPLFGKYPFPRLVNLKRLSFHSTYHTRDPLFKEGTSHNIYGVILEANQHITMLDLNYGNDWYSDLPHIPPHLTQSLQLTRFTVCDEHGNFRRKSALPEKLRPMINFNWKLHTLVLSLTSKKTSSDSMVSVLQMLHHFPTLKKVKFNRLVEFTIRETEKLGYLDLPNLEDFHVEMSSPRIDYISNIHFFFSLQFLVKCKGLKKLFWRMGGFNDTKGLRRYLEKQESTHFGEMIDFRGGMKNLYYSNLWHVFPSLDTIDVEIRKGEDVFGESCQHKYKRADIEGMSICKFWKLHWWHLHSPQTCVL